MNESTELVPAADEKVCSGLKGVSGKHVARKSEFGAVKTHADGLSRTCKACTKAYNALRKAAAHPSGDAILEAEVANKPAVTHQDGSPVFTATANQRAERVQAARKPRPHPAPAPTPTPTPVPQPAPSPRTPPIALPRAEEVETEAGQAALKAAADEAAAARRAANADAKRRQRAAAKARAAALVSRAE